MIRLFQCLSRQVRAFVRIKILQTGDIYDNRYISMELQVFMKKNLSEALIICFLAIGIAAGINIMRSDPLPFWVNDTPNDFSKAETTIQKIEIEAAIAHFDEQKALFADARSEADFAAGHISGAFNLPPQQTDLWFEKIFNSVEPEKTIITYCNGANCALAKQLAQILTEAGFEKVFYLVDGWGQWTKHNMPIEKGKL